MFGATPGGSGLVAILDRPATTPLAIAVAAVVAGWGWHVWAERSTDVRGLLPDGDRRPGPVDGRVEPPAVVALLTNGFRVPHAAVTATMLDLAARGWIRLVVVDDEVAVVTRGQGAAGDVLRPYEQQVMNHIASRAFNGVVSAGTLSASQHRLDRRWHQRFGTAVAAHAQALGLCSPRYTPVRLVPAVGAAAVALGAWVTAVLQGTDVDLDESWRSRLVGLATLAALAALVWAIVQRAGGSDQLPTDAGRQRAGQWLGYRARLRARIPSNATVLAPPAQQSALAVACVMGVAEHVIEQVPVASEDPRWAWSEAGDRARVVRVRYPIRPGYGQHPVKVAAVGVVVLVAARWVQGFLRRLADGETLQSLLDRVPGQIDLIETIATAFAIACWIPIIWGLWCLIAGAVDMIATRERIGLVVRTRRPMDVVPFAQSVKPFAERDRFLTYLAVDDGRRTAVASWLASERTAAPQGAQARVRATPLLGFVRSSEPVGTATNRSI